MFCHTGCPAEAARLRVRLRAGKRLPLHPVTHAAFLHATGLMSDDASVTSGQGKKYRQINHMISLIAPPFRALAKAMPGRTLKLLDAGCGNSYLSLAFAFLAREANAGRMPQIPDWKDTKFDLHVIGVDTNQHAKTQRFYEGQLAFSSTRGEFFCYKRRQPLLSDSGFRGWGLAYLAGFAGEFY